MVGPFTGSDLSSAGTPTDVLGPAEDLAPSGNCDASAVRAAQDEEGSFAGGTRARLHQAAPLTGGCDAAVVAAGQDSLEVGAAVAPLWRKELLRVEAGEEVGANAARAQMRDPVPFIQLAGLLL